MDTPTVENLMIQDLGMKIANLEIALAQTRAQVALLSQQQQVPEEGAHDDDIEDPVSS